MKVSMPSWIRLRLGWEHLESLTKIGGSARVRTARVAESQLVLEAGAPISEKCRKVLRTYGGVPSLGVEIAHDGSCWGGSWPVHTSM